MNCSNKIQSNTLKLLLAATALLSATLLFKQIDKHFYTGNTVLPHHGPGDKDINIEKLNILG